MNPLHLPLLGLDSLPHDAGGCGLGGQLYMRIKGMKQTGGGGVLVKASLSRITSMCFILLTANMHAHTHTHTHTHTPVCTHIKPLHATVHNTPCCSLSAGATTAELPLPLSLDNMWPQKVCKSCRDLSTPLFLNSISRDTICKQGDKRDKQTN